MSGARRFHTMVLASLLVLALAMPVAMMLDAAPGARGYSGITINLDRPAFAGKSETVPCTIMIAGGPASDGAGNFSYTAKLSGKNTTGSSITPSSSTSLTGIFKISVTMPSVAPETITITINASSKNIETGEIKHLESKFDMKVVDPILIKVEVLNKGPVEALNVTARFYADGVLLHSQVVNISGNATKTLYYNWTFLKISSGKHVITVSIDDPSTVVEFSDGNNVFSRTIYIEKTGNPLGAVMTVAVILLSVFVGLMYIQKPMKRKKT